MTRIQMRRGTAAAWTAANPILAAGEHGFETDTGKEKIGNGATAWVTLPYGPGGLVAKGALVINVKDYGAAADGVTDDTTAFRNAITVAVALGADVYAPAGVYSFTPTTNGIIIPLTVGNVHLRGAGVGVTVFKIKSAANPAAPVNWKAFIGSNTFSTITLDGLELSDFTFDYNTVGNPVTDVATLSSACRTVVMAPQGDYIRVRNVDVINGDGVWVAQLGGTSAGSIQGGYRCDDANIDITVYNWGAGSAYHDSSAVYIVGDRARVRGTFSAAATAPGAIAAVEMHGDDYDLSITVDGWATGANLTGLDMKTNSGGNAHDCILRNVMNGFVIWSGNAIGATGYGIDGLNISNNAITIDPDKWSAAGKASPPANFAHSGIGLNDMGTTYNLPMRNVKISGNTIRYATTTGTAPKILDAGISLVRAAVPAGTPARDENISIVDNTVDSPLSAGVVVSLNNSCTGLRIKGLTVLNPEQNGAGSITTAYSAAVHLTDKFFGLHISDVDLFDRRATPTITSVVNMAAVNNLDPPTGRQVVLDVCSLCTATGASTAPVVGPAGGTGGVYLRATTYGYYAVTGEFLYGSEMTDYANGHTYRQMAVGGGSTWQVWSEIRPEGVVVGGANVAPGTPIGLTYLPMLNNSGGAPSTAPTLRTGMMPMVVDGVGKVWLYYGGSWKGIATA